MSASVFIGRRLLSFALLCAFGSLYQQVEGILGPCGLYASNEIVVMLIKWGSFLAGIVALGCFLNLGPCKNRSEIITLLGLFYLATQMCSIEAIQDKVMLTATDRLLIEATVLLHPSLYSVPAVKFFILRVLLGGLAGKVSECTFNWKDWQSFKFDIINHPLPFAPMWHVNRLPTWMVSLFTIWQLLVEFTAGFMLFFSGGVESFAALSIFSYCLLNQLVANINWSHGVMMALVSTTLPEMIVEGMLGRELLRRWGWTTKQPLASKTQLESLIVNVLISGSVWGSLLGIAFWLGPISNRTLFDLVSYDSIIMAIAMSGIIGTWFFVFSTISAHPHKIRYVVVPLILAALSFDVVTYGWMGLGLGLSGWRTDYSIGVHCASFDDTAMQTRSGRSSLIFSARLDSLYPEERAVELALTGSTHIEDFRPTYQLFHFPRISLAVWRALTPYQADKASVNLIAKIRARMLHGHGSVKYIFHDSPDYRTARIIGAKKKIKDAFVYFQQYRPTERVADHIWYAKTDKFALVMDSKNAPAVEPLPECHADDGLFTWLPAQVRQLPIQSVVVSSALGGLIAKLLFLV